MANNVNADFMPNIPDSGINPTKLPYNPTGSFRFWAQKVLPLVYDDSLSYYEILCKVVDYLNNVIQNVDNLNDSVDSTDTSFQSLQTYVNNTKDTIISTYYELQGFVNTYFYSLDVQQEINAKLDAMADSGELGRIFAESLSPTVTAWVSSWLTANVNPVGSAVVVDSSLSISGAAADAKITGDNLTTLKSDLGAQGVPVLTEKWVDGYLKSDGSIQTAADYKTSQLIHIPAGFTLVFGSYASTSTYHFCNYEANGTFKSIGLGNTGLLGRQNIRIDAIEDRYVKICTNTAQISLSASNPHFERIKSEPTGLTDISNVGPVTGVVFVSGYLQSASPYGRVDSDVYYCSSVIFLQKGQTIEFPCSGSERASYVVQTTRSGSHIANLVLGNYDYTRLAYTNDTGDDIWVRICSRTEPGGNYVPLELFKDVKLYYKSLYLANEKLNGKKIVVIGDSLIYGNLLGNGVTWTAIMQNDTGADVYNYGLNGNAISSVSGGTGEPMSERYADIAELPTADIVVVEGGANDYNNSCPIGTLADTENNTFIGAINVLIDGIRELAPQAQILFMTTYKRTADANSAGLYYIDYANAMIKACENKAVPCYNNFANSGLDLTNANITAWCDEGLYLGHPNINRHFSPKAYDWLYPQYKHFIESRFA